MGMFKNLKYDIYQNLSLFFPQHFKKKSFSGLHASLKSGSNSSIPENELLVLQMFINEQSVVFDVGANNGLYCYYFQEIIKVKEIHAFEPIPSLFNKLNKWFKNIYFYPFAISDTQISTSLRIPYIDSIRYETRAKLDDLKEENETNYKEIKISTHTLDKLFLSSLSKVDFIKIDIEGHELKAIHGARELIKKHHPILMIEIEARHHQTKILDVIFEIEALGYSCIFLNYAERKFMEIKNFNVQEHQNVHGNPKNYINNFLFVPINSFHIDELNERLKTILN